MQHSDDKLVQLTLEGDHHAFAALVEKYQSQIHALVLRVHYRHYTTQWFDYLFVSKTEMEDILEETAWRVERYIDSANTPHYVAILGKCLQS